MKTNYTLREILRNPYTTLRRIVLLKLRRREVYAFWRETEYYDSSFKTFVAERNELRSKDYIRQRRADQRKWNAEHPTEFFETVCCEPGCNRCKREDGTWQKLTPQAYEELSAKAVLSHGYCPEHYEAALDNAREFLNSIPYPGA